MRRTGKYIAIICFVLLITILISCTKQEKTGRISQAELAMLREQYPYNDSISNSVSRIPSDTLFPTFDALLGNNQWKASANFRAAIVVELVDSWYTINDRVMPYDDKELNELALQRNPNVANIVWAVHDAKVSEVLWGGEGISKGDIITLGFGSTLITDGLDIEKVFQIGNKFVCFLEDWRNAELFHHESLFVTTKDHLFYITKDEVVLSVTSVPGADEASGLYLNSFEALVNETLGPPDAELTPVEPELEVE